MLKHFVLVCGLAGLGSGCVGAIEGAPQNQAPTGGQSGSNPGETTLPPPGPVVPDPIVPPGMEAPPGTILPPPPSSICKKPASPWPGSASLRRLTGTEYDNTMLELLGDTSAPGTSFPANQTMLGFDNNADASGVSPLLVEKYETTADRLARKAAQDLPALMGCAPPAADSVAEDACARRFIEFFGLRAYRRPLARDEIDRHASFYSTSKTKWGFQTAVRMVGQVMLQSPHFLYRVEGEGAPAGVAKVTPYELATRLSYLLWSSMPDQALLDAAATGGLQWPAQIVAQATRMLGDGRAKPGLRNFAGQWLELAHLQRAEKDPMTFPTWNPNIATLMGQETAAFVEEVVLRGEGTLAALLQAPYSFMNKDLAAFYGVKGPTGTSFQKVSLDPLRRGGVLTQGSFLAANAAPRQTSPVPRGHFVLDRLLCAPPPPPPANLNIAKFPEPDGRSTTRERLAKHRTDPACAGCHTLMDPIGLGFEHYDSAGLWRDRDAGKPIDATGQLNSAGDADGPFNGAAELTARLAGAGRVRECLVRQYFRFAFARGEQDEDMCTLDALSATMAGSGGSIRGLLTAFTQTDPFLYRNAEGGAP